MAEFRVTEKKPTKVEAKVALELNTEEIQFLSVAARYYATSPKFNSLVAQLENASHQAQAIENG